MITINNNIWINNVIIIICNKKYWWNNKSREYIRYRELDLNEKQIQSIHMVDIQFMSTFLFIVVLLSFCLRLFSSSEFALVSNSIKMIIGLVSAVVTTLLFYTTNKIMVTRTDHD